MSPHPSTRAVRCALGSVAAVLCAILMAPMAHAGPDDGRIVADNAHVDSPKIFWTGDTFELRSEFGKNVNPIDKTVNYLGHGYDKNGQTFMFTPQKQPGLGFLGPEAGTWYMAPQLPFGGHSPIWAGFGADAKIPVEKFRDAVFTLDLVSTNGPGRMEAFAWTPASDGFAEVVGRLLSSTDPRYRSRLMTAGVHTHNYTLFSHPGRYEMRFRATARSTDGRLIHSKDQTLVWQVGGAKPGTSLPGKSEKAMAASAPTFQIAPATTGGKDPKVTKQLSNLRVDLGKAVNGKAVVSVNGFHYTDLTITGGVGEFQDLLGVGSATYQVKVTGADGSEWTSAPLKYTAGQQAVDTVESGAPVKPVPADSQKFPFAAMTAKKQIGFTLKFGPGKSDGSRAVDLKFDDPTFTGFLKFGAFSTKESKYPEESATEHVPSGGLKSESDVTESSNGQHAIIDVLPHPMMANVKSARYEVADKYDIKKNYEFKGVLSLAGSAEPTPEPTPTPQPGGCESGLVILDNGHLDMSAISKDGKLGIALKDDSRIAAPESVDRPLDKVGLLIGDRAVIKREAKYGSAWDQILAPVGQDSWVLPVNQLEGLPWPGYSTERADHKQYPGGVRLELVNAKGPGDVALFLPDSFGGTPKVVMGTRKDAPRSITIKESTHAHVGWAFTKPGVYKMSFRYVGVGADGAETATETQTLNIGVGTASKKQLCAKEGTPAPKPEPKPDPTPAPGVNPKPVAPKPEVAGAPAPMAAMSEPTAPAPKALLAKTGPGDVLPLGIAATLLIGGGAGAVALGRKRA